MDRQYYTLLFKEESMEHVLNESPNKSNEYINEIYPARIFPKELCKELREDLLLQSNNKQSEPNEFTY